MIRNLPLIMLYCLSCTVIIECGIAFISGIRKAKDLLFVLLVNIMTNPLLVVLTVIVNLFFGRLWYYISLAVLEIGAVAAEGLVYKFTIKHKLNPFLLSLILNSASFFLGLIINRIVF